MAAELGIMILMTILNAELGTAYKDRFDNAIYCY
jgi:hypothetical protein